MSNDDYLAAKFPRMGSRLPRIRLAALPTRAYAAEVRLDARRHRIFLKRDDETGSLYGGNKLRKLEYIFPVPAEKRRRRIATFGAVGSNSALAVALYARKLGFDSTCFLMHQAKTPFIPATLNLHIRNGTEIARYGGAYASRIGTLREHLWSRDAWVIPMGCSSWRGTAGFVAAGLELAEQVAAGDIPQPDRIYVGTGTMGTAAGLGLGLAIAGLETEVHAVRVSHTSITNERLLCRLTEKTVTMLRRLDDTLPADAADRVNIRLRDEFFGDGYAHGTGAADEAIAFAAEQLDLPLEPTYTGKTMAALLADIRAPGGGNLNLLYWNTYCALPATVPSDCPLDRNALPAEFLRYFE